ncbi:MAG: PDZ domain-containing protein, partial [Alphaproteobacteria bacterium]|nr:PDZ domain-containing protein [Alphaproteobacteria bacterium]
MRTGGLRAIVLAAVMAHVSPAAAAGENHPAGFVGMQVQGLSVQAARALGLTEAKGALVRDIAPGGPAEKAGIRQGDLIVRVGTTEIDTFETLLRVVGQGKPDENLSVAILRGGKTVDAILTFGSWPASWKIERDATGHLAEAGL